MKAPEVSLANVRRHTEHIANEIPSRLAGTMNGRRMAEYSRDALRDAGVAAEMVEIPGLVSFPEAGTIELPGAAPSFVAANTLGHSTATPPGGLTAELVDLGGGGLADYAGRDVAGKIVLVEFSRPPARHEKQRIAAEMGAAGCIMINWGPPDCQALPFGSVKPGWGNPASGDPAWMLGMLPCLGVSRADGLRLRAMVAQGPLRLRMATEVENAWRPVQLTLGEIAAPHGHGDFVVVGGHQDSWPGPQATDNAVGNAVMIELARAFARHAGTLRRGLVFGFWTGHETGTMIGSSWFVERHWDRLRQHAVAYLQIDQPGCAGTTRWETASQPELQRFHREEEAQVLRGREAGWRRAARAGDASFFGIGVPMLMGQGAFSAADLAQNGHAPLGWWHHSLENTLDRIDWDYLAEHVQLYAAWLWRLCMDPVLPTRFTAVAEELLARLSALGPAGSGIGLDGTIARARSFRAAAIALDAAADAWTDRFAQDAAAGEVAAAALNEGLKRLSRLLVPLSSTLGGAYQPDPYGFSPLTAPIPSLHEAPLLATVEEGVERWMLETRLLRLRNHVGDVLADAIRVAEAAVGQAGLALARG